MAGYDQVLKSFKVMRSLRALRPLRVIGRSEALRVAIGSLFGALPAIFNGITICSLIVFIYAIIGISFFKGKFWSCTLTDPSIETKQDCLNAGG